MPEKSSTDKALLVLGTGIAAWGILGMVGSRGTGLVAWAGLLCGFSYLAFSLLCVLQSPARSTRVLAAALLGCSLVFMAGPGFESAFLGSVFSVLRSGLVLAGFAGILHFLLLYPEPGPFAGQTRNIRVLYVPAFLFWLLVSYRAIFAAEASGAINTFTYVIAGLIMSGYLLSGVVVFLRRYIRCPQEERERRGMRLMLWGSVAGFLPALVGFMPVFSGLPGNEIYFVSLSILPLVWTNAAKLAV